MINDITETEWLLLFHQHADILVLHYPELSHLPRQPPPSLLSLAGRRRANWSCSALLITHFDSFLIGLPNIICRGVHTFDEMRLRVENEDISPFVNKGIPNLVGTVNSVSISRVNFVRSCENAEIERAKVKCRTLLPKPYPLLRSRSSEM